MKSPPIDPRARTAAVLVAAGSSRRMGPGLARKPFLELEGRTVLEHSAAALGACEAVTRLVVVVREDDVERVRALAAGNPAFAKLHAIVPGGAERAESVLGGVRAAGEDVHLVAIHDAARPLVSAGTVARSIELAAREGAALVAARVSDTIHRSTDGRTACEALDRGELWSAQTPQVFERARLLELLELGLREGLAPTDEATLWERHVGPVPLLEAEGANIKITTADDLPVAAALLRGRAAGGAS